MDHSELKGALLALLRDDTDVRAAVLGIFGDALERMAPEAEIQAILAGLQARAEAARTDTNPTPGAPVAREAG